MSIGRIGRKRKSNLSLRWMPYRMLFYHSQSKDKLYFTKLKTITLERPSYVKITRNEINIIQSIGSNEFTECELVSIKKSIENEAVKLIGIKIEEDYKINITLVGNDE